MEDLRPLLTVYAYNILGSWEEAKDAVQDVFLKFITAKPNNIKDEKAYLVRMVVNRAIDKKEKLAREISGYEGPWLPEGVATDNPEMSLWRKEILSYAMMVLLEKLDARQRAVFILKEAFDYNHDDIAHTLGITAENSRQLLSRAKKELQSEREGGAVSSAWLAKYIAVIEAGDMTRLEQLLNEDVSVMSDGGGKAQAFRNIIRGVKDVTALLAGLFRKTKPVATLHTATINHSPALLYVHNGHVVTCQVFSIKNGRIDHVFFIRNPDKLVNLQHSF